MRFGEEGAEASLLRAGTGSASIEETDLLPTNPDTLDP